MNNPFMIPAAVPLRELPEEMRGQLRGLIRSMVCSDFIEQNLGCEGVEEYLEQAYDSGRIKLTYEPTEKGPGGRIMLFDDKKSAYIVITKLKIEGVTP